MRKMMILPLVAALSLGVAACSGGEKVDEANAALANTSDEAFGDDNLTAVDGALPADNAAGALDDLNTSDLNASDLNASAPADNAAGNTAG